MQLIIRNTDVHNHNTRSKESLHVPMGRTGRTYIIKMFAFMTYTSGIYFSNMSRQIFHMQASNMCHYDEGAHCVNRGCVALSLISKFRVIPQLERFRFFS